MKQKQMRRLLKAKKKMNRMANEALSEKEIMNNFEYMLKTARRLMKDEEKINSKKENI